MILYDKNHKIRGISEKSLKILGYKSTNEFINKIGDLEKILYGYKPKKQSILFDILQSENSQKNIRIITENNTTISLTAKATKIELDNDDSAYCIDLIPEEKHEQITKKNMPDLRLPELNKTKIKNINAKSGAYIGKLDKKWLELTQFLLDLNKDELIKYLTLFLHEAQKLEISLQNALMSQDTVNISRTAQKLYKISSNLHIMPLSKIYEKLQKTQSNNHKSLITAAHIYLKELSKLLSEVQ